ncbi:hypothetical protein BDZ97DRAFT_1754959 [Flammula alnicola]|nr:hypothetical protein BDZ97DRAFT_1754959 [Flammula alnicola]
MYMDRSRSRDADDEDKPTGPGYSPGPIPSAAKDAAYAAHVEFMEKLENLAKEYNKPVKHFLSLVGSDVPSTRRLSTWDAYQRWYPAHVKEKPDEVSAQDWAKHVALKYQKELTQLTNNIGSDKPSWEAIEKHFESTQVYEESGIHIFGFAIKITPESCSSIAWGGSLEYKKLRKSHKTVIQMQIHDYEGLFKVAEMRTRDLETANLQILGEFLHSDLAHISVQQDSDTTPEEHAKVKMNWYWTDHAYKNEL